MQARAGAESSGVPSGRAAGRWMVVTGASSGIGRATAERLAAEGATLLVHARRNREGLASLLEQIGGERAGHRMVLEDLSNEAGAERLVERAWDWSPRVDAWVHLAGADVLTGEMRSATFEEKLDALWRTDVLGTIATARRVGRRMMTQPTSGVSPAIVTVGWDQVQHGMAGDAGEMFGPIKGAVEAFTRSLARTLAPRVRVVGVAPGWIRTAWGETASEAWDRRAREESLLGRWGEAGDVAATVAFLVSPDAAFVHGQILAVNGGFRHAHDPAG